MRLADGTTALASDGAPSDCVSLALLGLVEGPVDLVVSGINPNANLGHDVTYSGTVTAAMEAALNGVLGFGRIAGNTGCDRGTARFRLGCDLRAYCGAGGAGKRLAAQDATECERALLTDAADQRRAHHAPGPATVPGYIDHTPGPARRALYWIGGEMPKPPSLEGSDADALAEGYVSITPFQMDLTDYGLMELLKEWKFGE